MATSVDAPCRPSAQYTIEWRRARPTHFVPHSRKRGLRRRQNPTCIPMPVDATWCRPTSPIFRIVRHRCVCAARFSLGLRKHCVVGCEMSRSAMEVGMTGHGSETAAYKTANCPFHMQERCCVQCVVTCSGMLPPCIAMQQNLHRLEVARDAGAHEIDTTASEWPIGKSFHPRQAIVRPSGYPTLQPFMVSTFGPWWFRHDLSHDLVSTIERAMEIKRTERVKCAFFARQPKRNTSGRSAASS